MNLLNVDQMEQIQGGTVTTSEVVGGLVCGAALISGWGALIFGPSCIGMLVYNAKS